MSTMLQTLKQEIQSLADTSIAEHSQRYFKTEEGSYGHGDIFLGIRVPVLRQKAKQYKDLPLTQAWELLKSPYHEMRLLALFILVAHFDKADQRIKKEIYQNYLKHTSFINNWDLVDSSAHKIIGPYLFDKDTEMLMQLAHSEDLWEKRIAVIATFYFINKDRFDESLKIAAILLEDTHDLIHKAVGWMLREVGNKNRKVEEDFLKPLYKSMPRTMLRYAIEKFPEELRKAYLKGAV